MFSEKSDNYKSIDLILIYLFDINLINYMHSSPSKITGILGCNTDCKESSFLTF